MQLVHYLEGRFYTRRELLKQSAVADAELQQWIDLGVAPRASYRVNGTLACDSFLGKHSEVVIVEYFARGTSSWLGLLRGLVEPTSARAVFEARYRARLASLAEEGFVSSLPKFRDGIDDHIESEWRYFLDGVYGLCTRSGLPEDIAAKELATAIIESLVERPELSASERDELKSAVDLLDASAADFAPHERPSSSRYRLVDEVRRKFQLVPG